MLKAKSGENFRSPKIFQILTYWGPWRSGGMKSSDFTAKGTRGVMVPERDAVPANILEPERRSGKYCLSQPER